jgi:hypothetical protein
VNFKGCCLIRENGFKQDHKAWIGWGKQIQSKGLSFTSGGLYTQPLPRGKGQSLPSQPQTPNTKTGYRSILAYFEIRQFLNFIVGGGREWKGKAAYQCSKSWNSSIYTETKKSLHIAQSAWRS